MNNLLRFAAIQCFLLISYSSQAADIAFPPWVTVVETPGLVRGESMEPYSTDDVTFSSVIFSSGITTGYHAVFAQPQTHLAAFWETVTPVDIPGLEFVSFYGGNFVPEFYDAEGNLFHPSGGSGGGGTVPGLQAEGYFSPERPFVAADLYFQNDRAFFLDRTGCTEGDLACGVQVVKSVPFNIVNIFFEYSPTPPIPEPETYALMLSGLGMLGYIARRQKNSNKLNGTTRT